MRTSPAPNRIDRSSSTCPGTRMQRRSAAECRQSARRARSPGARLYLVTPRSTSRVPEPLGAGEKGRGEVAVAQQAFQIAAAARIEIHPARVEHQRGRRQEVGAEPDRADEPVLDANQRHAGTGRRLGKALRQARRPASDRAVLRAAMRAGRLQRPCDGAAEHRHAGRRANEIGDPAPLPERHADADRDAAVGGLDPAPIGDDRQRLLEGGCGVAERIAVARRDEADAGENFVDRAAEAVSRHRGVVFGRAPAGIGSGGKGGHRDAGEQREETDLAAGAVDALGAVEQRPRVAGARRSRSRRALAPPPAVSAVSGRSATRQARRPARAGRRTTPRRASPLPSRDLPSGRRRHRPARVRRGPRRRGRPRGSLRFGARFPPGAADPRRDQRLCAQRPLAPAAPETPNPARPRIVRGVGDTGRRAEGAEDFRRAGAQDRRRARSAPRRAQHALGEPRDGSSPSSGNRTARAASSPFRRVSLSAQSPILAISGAYRRLARCP